MKRIAFFEKLQAQSISLASGMRTPFFYIFGMSLIAYAGLAYVFPISFYPDSEQYVRTARAIINLRGGEFYYFRTWGYPLIMNLFGVTTLKSFYPLLIFQLVSAALIPPLIYATVKNIFPRAAIYAALISCISFSPGFFSGVIMTDQSAMFLRHLLLYLTSICIFRPLKKTHFFFSLLSVLLCF